MKAKHLYVHGSDALHQAIRDLVDPDQTHVESLSETETLPLHIFEKPCVVIWQDPPDKDTPIGQLLRMLYGFEHVTILVGSAEQILKGIPRLLDNVSKPATNADVPVLPQAPPTPDKRKPMRGLSVILVAPEGGGNPVYGFCKDLGANIDHRPIPQRNDHAAILKFRQSLQAAEHLIVWHSPNQPKEYDRIASVIHKMTGRVPFQLNDQNWADTLDEHFIHVPLDPDLIDTVDENEDPYNEDVTDTLVSSYVEAMHQFMAHNSRHRTLVHHVKEKGPLKELSDKIDRWEKQALDYKHTSKSFVPAPMPECPDNASSQSRTWQAVVDNVREQSALARSMLILRQDIISELGESRVMQTELLNWDNCHDMAQTYFSLIQFRQTLNPYLDHILERESGDDAAGGGFFRSRSERAMEEAEQALEERLASSRQAWAVRIQAERDSLNLHLIANFWLLYRQVAISWLESPMREAFLDDSQRKFLRMGVVPQSILPWPEDIKSTLLDKVYSQRKVNFKRKDQEAHIVYMDEFLELLKAGTIQPSYDENLELNEKGTEAFRADRKLRRSSNGMRMQSILSRLRQQLEAQHEMLTNELETIQFTTTVKGGSRKGETLHDQMHEIRVEIGRVNKKLKTVFDLLTQVEVLPDEQRFDRHFPLGYWVEKEVAHLRAKTRLMNHLREGHIPDIVISQLSQPSPILSTVTNVTELQSEVINNDPSLFDHVLVEHPNRKHALVISDAPVVLIAPGNGELAVSLEPAHEGSEGRMIMPMFVDNNQGQYHIFVDACSDFRWDSSMMKAGSDWVASDTLVAAYSRCRWDYRHRSKEVREKALVFKEETDKRNWRRHYRLFEKSSQDGGRLLYYKSKHIYNNMLKYLPLPEGIKKIRET